MKINTQNTLKDLAGKDIKNGNELFTMGMALGNILANSPTGGKHKMFILATKCYQNKEVEIDKADLELIKNAIETTDQYNNLVSGQILQLLVDIKDDKKKKKKHEKSN